MMVRRVLVALLAALLAVSCYRPIADESEAPPVELGEAEKERAAESYVQAGLGHMRTGNFTVAQKRFEHALKLRPQFHLAYMGLGLLYARTEQWGSASSSFEKALRIAPDDTNLLNNYGQYLCQRDDTERAMELLLKSAQNKFNNRPEIPYTNLAVCMINVGKNKEAENHLFSALQVAPQFAQALLPMAKLLYDRGAVDDSRHYLQRYEQVAAHSAISLWLGLQIERDSGNSDGIETYKFLLQKKFPDSEEARKMRETGTW